MSLNSCFILIRFFPRKGLCNISSRPLGEFFQTGLFVSSFHVLFVPFSPPPLWWVCIVAIHLLSFCSGFYLLWVSMAEFFRICFSDLFVCLPSRLRAIICVPDSLGPGELKGWAPKTTRCLSFSIDYRSVCARVHPVHGMYAGIPVAFKWLPSSKWWGKPLSPSKVSDLVCFSHFTHLSQQPRWLATQPKRGSTPPPLSTHLTDLEILLRMPGNHNLPGPHLGHGVQVKG